MQASTSRADTELIVLFSAAKSPLVQTTVFPIDLSRPTTEAFSDYKKWIESSEVQVGILVNNAGVSHSMPVSFAETSLEEMENILQVVSRLSAAEGGTLDLSILTLYIRLYDQNIHATLLLTRITLPHLIAKRATPGPKVKSLILNIGSFGGTVPSPLLATYSASKAFLATWNKALGEEVKSNGVVVRLILPGFVVSVDFGRPEQPVTNTALMPECHVLLAGVQDVQNQEAFHDGPYL
jgi:17beta-estradiol 17-dehydrogenase / very-long-chain 3-oxoacyl-CoA reductase